MPDRNGRNRYRREFLRARREAWLILAAWAACLLWTVGYSGVTAYGTAAGAAPLVLGMPAWVVWGVLAPWVAAVLFSVWFSLRFMTDEDFAEPPSEGEDGPAE